MFKWNAQLLWKVLVVSSLLSPFALFSSSLNPTSKGQIIGWLADQVVYPVQYLWVNFIDSATGAWDHYVDLTDAAQENSELKRQVEALQAELLDYQELSDEVKRLRKILGFNQYYQRDYIAAKVISPPQDSPFEAMRVSKGALSEVMVGMPVITGQGAVGRVIRTGLYHADVQLLTDANFHIDVLLQRTRVRGVLSGTFGGRCLLKLNRRAEVRIGDTIVTSGLVGSFPKGIPVGRVVRISYDIDNITQGVTVEPWVNPIQVEEVVILKTIDSNMRKIINTAGENWLDLAVGAAEPGRG